MNAQPENNIKNNDNVWENIKIEEDKAEEQTTMCVNHLARKN